MAKKLKAVWGTKNQITVGFFSPSNIDNQQTNCVSWLVNSWTNGQRIPALCFTHVELRFSDNMAISITNEGIHYEQRILSSNGYSTFFQITVNNEQERQMKKLAQNIYKSNPSFNWFGLLWNFAPLTQHCAIKRRNAYFCTELIVILLQKADIFIGYNPSKISPNDLYDMCMHEPLCVLSYNRVKMEK